MKWMIATDHKTPGGDGRPVGSKEIVDGLNGFTPEKRLWIKVGVIVALPYSFRIYHQDGKLYYSGVSSDRKSEEAFEPLEWAAKESGCTRIEYRQDDGTWETL